MIAIFLILIFSLSSGLVQAIQYYDDTVEFEIVIPSYNNAPWCVQNLNSAVTQTYPHFHVTYVDDCSTDGTGEMVDRYVEENNLQDRVTVIHNKQRCGAMANWYYTISTCADHKVIIHLDGDDKLAHSQVLWYLARLYKKYDIWLTYGQFSEGPQRTGWCVPMPQEVIESNTFRYFEHMPSHLRTHYAWLFKKIKKEDLMHEGKLVAMTCDQAMIFPMIEMAGERHAFISKILYHYNAKNTISDHRIDEQSQRYFSKIIRAKPRYMRLEQPDISLRSCKPLFRVLRSVV